MNTLSLDAVALFSYIDPIVVLISVSVIVLWGLLCAVSLLLVRGGK